MAGTLGKVVERLGHAMIFTGLYSPLLPSVRPGTCLLTSLCKAGGVDIDEIGMSRSTLSRKTHAVLESDAQIIREENLDKISGSKLVLHFDTKIMKQFTREKGISTCEERLAISASLPESGPVWTSYLVSWRLKVQLAVIRPFPS